MRFHLESLKTTGFMRHDRTLAFGRGINVVVGPNGAGKTQLVESLRVLVRGTPSIVGASPDDLMLLARNDPEGYSIRGVWNVNDGIRRQDSGPVIRSVSRNPKTEVVSQAISAPGLISNSAGVAAKKATLAQRLGGWAEAWHPLDWRKGGPELRRTLVSLLGGGSGLRPEDFLPPDAPDYIRPQGEAEEIIDVWVEGARERARTAARVAEEAVQVLVAVHADQIDGGGVAPDPQPIRDRMTRLLDERQRAAGLRDRRARLDRDRADLDRARARLPARRTTMVTEEQLRAADEACDAYVAAQAELGRARAEALARNTASAEAVRRAELALQAHRAKPESKWVRTVLDDLGPQGAIEALVERTGEALLQAIEEAGPLAEAAREAAAALRGAESVQVHLAECPKCHFDLREFQALQRASAGQALQEALQAAAAAEQRVIGARAANQAALAQQQLIKWRVEDERLAAELDAAHAAARPPASVPTLDVADPRPERAKLRLEMASALDAETQAAAVGRRELELARWQADLDVDAEGMRTIEEIEADLEVAEAELEVALNGQQRLRDFADVVARKRAATARAEAAREWVPRMEAVYTQVMEAIRSAIEVPCSRIGAADYRLVLQDPRGKPDCRLQRNGVDFATLSEGEQALATIAILRALGPTSGAEWRPLFVDRLQAIDPLGRQRVASAARQAIEAHEIDQAFLLGCIPLDEARELVRWIGTDDCPANLINLSDLGAAELANGEVLG